MKVRSIIITNSECSSGHVRIRETAGNYPKGLIIESPEETLLGLTEIQELIDAIQTLRPEKETKQK